MMMMMSEGMLMKADKMMVVDIITWKIDTKLKTDKVEEWAENKEAPIKERTDQAQVFIC